MEVAVYIPCEEHLTPQTRNLGSCVGMEGEPHDQLTKQTVDCKPESGMEGCVP